MVSAVWTRKKFPPQPGELDDGNREYKWYLNNNHRPAKIATQLRYRLYEGDGKALYIVGILDDGTPKGVPFEQLVHSLRILLDASKSIGGTKLSAMRFYGGNKGLVATVRFSNNVLDTNMFM